ncbi:MAG: hypothetical protein QUT30_13410 [Acidobacteriota bacterium]|nr:hypothetical protein [Acidobacteriota bacterium]
MHQDPQRHSGSIPGSIKQLFFDTERPPADGSVYAPYFYAEVRIDFNDVRTGYRTTVSLSKAVEIHAAYPDLLIAEDMVRDIDPQRIKAAGSDAAFRGTLPPFVDTGFMAQMEAQFIQYLMRCFKARVYRNSVLAAYSNAGESLSEFASRCLDMLSEARRLELDALHDVFTRRLEQIRQKHLSAGSSESLDRAKAESQDRNLFLGYSDRIADLFLKPEISLNARTDARCLPENNPDLAENLAALESEARQSVSVVCDAYLYKSQSMDEYILHPNLKDIHLVRCCILWIPVRGA